MTIMKVCAVYDAAMDAYMRPFFVPTTNMAVRSFIDEVNRAADDNPIWKHPEDYRLVYLCDFDESTGRFDTQSNDAGGTLIHGRDAQRKPA